jgi:hypothetical protein
MRVFPPFRAQPEHLALSEPAAQTDYDGYPASGAYDVADLQRRRQQPSLAALL